MFYRLTGSAKQWPVLAMISTAQLMVVLDISIVNVALPSMQSDLGFTNASREWVVTSYALAFGSLLLLGGRLTDLFGPKRSLLTGLVGFAAASALGGAAQSFGMLVIARTIQGSFGALLAPAALALLTTTFTGAVERGKAFGIFGAVAVSGSSIGLLLGGGLTEVLSWRWTLYVNLAFAVPTVVAGAMLLTHSVRSRRGARLDLAGAATASSGLFLLILGLSNAGRDGWTDVRTAGTLFAAIVLLGGFVLIESRTESPLLPLHILADRIRGGSYLAIGFNSLGLFAVFLFLTYYLQDVRGLSPLATGLAFLPLALTIVVVAKTVTGRLLPRFGPRVLLTVGPICGALGMLWLAQLTPASGYAGHVLPAMVLIGLAAGFTVAPAMSTATSGVAEQDAGIASATVNAAQQVGGALGLAVLGTVAATATGIQAYTLVFHVTAAVYVGAAAICWSLLRPRLADRLHAAPAVPIPADE